MGKMIKCMTQAERYEDISKRSGLPLEVVKRVMDCEAASVLDSLKRGERAVLYGRCSMTPVIKKRVGLMGVSEKVVTIDCKPSPILGDTLNQIAKYEIQEDNLEGIRVKTLSYLD